MPKLEPSDTGFVNTGKVNSAVIFLTSCPLRTKTDFASGISSHAARTLFVNSLFIQIADDITPHPV